MVEATNPPKLPVTALVTAPLPAAVDEVELPVAAAAADVVLAILATESLELATVATETGLDDAARVTVTKVVDTPAQDGTAGSDVLDAAELDRTEATFDEFENETAAAAVLFEDEVDADEAAPGVPTVPSTALVVKLEKPWVTMTSATLFPVASKGVVREVAAFAFSTAEPPTAGSTRGTTPRRAAVVGRVGSLQMDGTLTLKGLKFCSAPASPRAAAIT